MIAGLKPAHFAIPSTIAVEVKNVSVNALKASKYV
jgi:hypothetical protein